MRPFSRLFLLCLLPTLAFADPAPQSHRCLFGDDVSSIFSGNSPAFSARLLGKVNEANADSTFTGAFEQAVQALKSKLTHGKPDRYRLIDLMERVHPEKGIDLFEIIHRPTGDLFFAFRFHNPVTETIQGGHPLNAGMSFERPMRPGWYMWIERASEAVVALPLVFVEGQGSAYMSGRPYVVSSCWINERFEKTWTSPGWKP